jgi:hypothetical protein
MHDFPYGYYENNWLYSLYSKLYSPEYEMNYPFRVLELIAAVLILLCLCLCDPYPCPWVAFVGFRGKAVFPTLSTLGSGMLGTFV